MTQEDLELIKYYLKWRKEDGHFATMPSSTNVNMALDKLIKYCEMCMKLNDDAENRR